MPHALLKDYNCARCGMLITTGIPHECDPTICKKCNGKGFLGFVRHRRKCPECDNGKWTPPEHVKGCEKYH